MDRDPSPGRWLRRASLLLAVAVALHAPAAGAETVLVAFDFGELPSLLLADAAAVEAAAEGGLAAALGEAVPFWSFEPAAGRPPHLTLRLDEVEETGDWDLVLAVTTPPGFQEAPSRAPFFSAGELADRGGFPPENLLAGQIERRFRANLLDAAHLAPNQGELMRKLQKWLPVARRAHLAAGEAHGVLGLPWQSHRGLARSVFRIECRDGDERTVDLYSHGTGRCLSFPVQPSFEAIEVRHDQWRPADVTEAVALPAEELGELGGLEPVSVYLDQQGMVVTGACDPSAPVPTLAPGGGAR
jgi:hypothetical protein